MQTRFDKWDYRFIDLANNVSQWSKEKTTKVGAVIVDGKRRVVSVAYNGFPMGVSDAELPRDRKLMRVCHAELNAIFFASRNVAGCTLYCTHPPCSQCAAAIIQNGIKRVIAVSPDNNFITRWRDSHYEALMMFDEAGVSYDQVERDE